ncbi:hypothetical protein P153DRAFT_348337 [Dothidotthia symphoricarpi CBS 119687]|uniref:Conserved oligomeric Golgi complex subunit 2 n=1 Tax=Dothidotthia symphoricarpi CBS 119687 TaxID=1392245 RepID=A0A6A6A3Z5_9PLEO|nr:uncharacterized protein P153DRAFT_348337 [Dothidotthia symphoricarpi CBS 119687]KAF2125311.1 hypothetical protein P153DRAFT_348337 [Dothidotthia symphoricarpi CBS 119687]
MSKFYLPSSRSPSPTPSSTSTTSSTTSSLALPYPLPLQRADFLAPNFTPATYLSSRRSQHQTLEDLRAELRSRSQLLSKELLDLVNGNYQDFLNLGNSLHGGEERVEGVRVGLLGFRKEVHGLREGVGRREEEVAGLLGERRGVRRGIEIGRRLVEWDARVGELETELRVDGRGREGDGDEEVEDSDEEEDDEEEGAYGVSVAKLARTVAQYRLIQELEKGVQGHPFIAAQTHRMLMVRSTLLLDLSAALGQAKKAGTAGSGRIMKVMKIYADMDESAEAVKVLRSLKTTT